MSLNYNVQGAKDIQELKKLIDVIFNDLSSRIAALEKTVLGLQGQRISIDPKTNEVIVE